MLNDFPYLASYENLLLYYKMIAHITLIKLNILAIAFSFILVSIRERNDRFRLDLDTHHCLCQHTGSDSSGLQGALFCSNADRLTSDGSYGLGQVRAKMSLVEQVKYNHFMLFSSSLAFPETLQEINRLHHFQVQITTK